MADTQNNNSVQTLQIRKIFGYTPVYTYIANLTDHDLYLPYVGRGGYRFEPLSESTTPIFNRIRQHKTYRTRVEQYNQLLKDVEEGRIAIGSQEEVQQAIDTARSNS